MWKRLPRDGLREHLCGGRAIVIEPIYREFSMNSKAWPIATFVVAVLAVGAGVYGLNQHSEVTSLTAQLHGSNCCAYKV